MERILVGIDFSACSQAALDCAVAIAAKLGAALDCVHAWQAPGAPPGADVGAFQDAARREVERDLDAVVGERRAPGVEVTARLIEGPAVAAILGAAQAGRHLMIVVGTHGRTGVTRAALGSVAEAIVRAAPCPVLCVRGTTGPSWWML